MKTLKTLHFLSHLKWLFTIWMTGLMIYIFMEKPGNTLQLVGNVIFLAGIVLGFDSLRDSTKIDEKTKRYLRKKSYVNRSMLFLYAGTIILVLISIFFFSLRIIIPSTDKAILNDFKKLGYDCLVMMLGFLCLIKQLIEQVEFANKQID